MKKNFLLLIVCFVSISLSTNAKQPIKFDFEAGLPTTIFKHCADASMADRYLAEAIVTNPNPTGNPSSKALKYEQTNGLTQWQGFKWKLDTPISLTDLRADSITHISVKFYEAVNNIATTAGNLSVKLLLSWKGEYENESGATVLADGQVTTGYGTEIGPDINALPVVTNHPYQTWHTVTYPFTPNLWAVYNSPYKQIVGIAVSPVRAMGYTPGNAYVVYIDDVTIHFKSSQTSLKSIKSNPESLKVNVNGNTAKISFNVQLAGTTEVAIYDISGKLISRQSVNASAGWNSVNAEIGSAGIYLAKVTGNNQSLTSKFVK